ncbi:neural cell adhesion molecule 2-like [Thrips palmi]|uniref:Neural cell adhesion molecule 2-like n=1 Tax=Thrips palmi TaxID=161013 RepID=A0A6P8YPE6_THRPL|nr:neural cell adhesion molecule 2-like [Thrips palmi]
MGVPGAPGAPRTAGSRSSSWTRSWTLSWTLFATSVALLVSSAAAASRGVVPPKSTATALPVMSVEGTSVQLPCDVTAPSHDKVYMVLWFKDDAGLPLYSLDVRGKPIEEATHQSLSEGFGTRAYFRTVSETAQLVVNDIRRHDEGVYRCRVDFRHSASRSFRYNLTVVVPPEPPAVLDQRGRQLNSTVGPHREGDNISLTCRVVGGKPQPRVRWLVNGTVVDDTSESNAGDVIENHYTKTNVSRADLNAVFVCQAVNTNLTEPRQTSLRLDLHCESSISTAAACRPIPGGQATCFLKKTNVDNARDNVTVSHLTFTPAVEDNGKELTCRAENPNTTGLFVETSWRLDVVYAPIVSLRLGLSLSREDIKEGDDVYFECIVHANPPLRKLNWFHNGHPLHQNASARILRSNQSLVLQRVTRASAGTYTCVGSNAEGESSSNKLDFRVKFVPTCRWERSVVGAIRGVPVDVHCAVESDPPARQFRWKFNNSGETMDVAADRYVASSNGSVSVLRYTALSDHDYGTLSCLAENSVGAQQEPCVFTVISAALPTPPRNCTLLNQTASSAEVWCLAGADGGLPQHFVLELYTASSSGPVARYNATERPVFLLSNLEPDVTFKVVVVAANDKGRSSPVAVSDLTFGDPEKRVAVDGDLVMSPVVAGAVIGVALCLVSATLCVAVHLRKCLKPGVRAVGRNGGLGSDKGAVVGLGPPPGKTTAHARDPADEKDPDIIPAKFDPIVPRAPANGTLAAHGVPGVPARSPAPPTEAGGVSPSGRMPGLAGLAGLGPAQGNGGPPKAASPEHWVRSRNSSGFETTHHFVEPWDSWDLRPKDLRLSKSPSSSSTDRRDLELNGSAIKDRLMSSRVPESCV